MTNEQPDHAERLTSIILALVDSLQLDAELDPAMPIEERQAWVLARRAVETGRLRLAFVPDRDEDTRSLASLLNRRLYAAPIRAVARDADDPSLALTMVDQVGDAMGAEDEPRRWDERAFFAALAANLDPEAVGAAYAIIGWARDRGLPIRWSEGAVGSFSPWLGHDGVTYEPLTIDSGGEILIRLDALLESPAFAPRQQAFADHVRVIATPDAERNARTHLSALRAADALESFIAAIDWIVDTIQSS